MATQPLSGEDLDDLAGVVLADRYRLQECIGQGGIGAVYRARHLTLGNFVAVKVLLAEYQERDVLRKRFEREAAALAELSHPNIVRVTDFGVHERMPYLAMELLEGDDLAALLLRGEVDPERGVGIVRQALRALAYAHGRDVIHRDVKPHNVFVRALDDGTDHVHVLDFGLARFLGDTVGGAGQALTRTGAVMGTPAYMAPEQATGDQTDARTDVYSTGVVLYQVLAGRRPFVSHDPAELIRMHLLEEPPDPETVNPELEISEGMRALLKRALAKPRSERFRDARQMLDALDALDEPVARAASGAARPPTRRTPAEDLATANTLAASPAASGSASGRAAPRPAEPAEPTPAERPSEPAEPTSGQPTSDQGAASKRATPAPAAAPSSAPSSGARRWLAIVLGVGVLLAAGGGLFAALGDDEEVEPAAPPPRSEPEPAPAEEPPQEPVRPDPPERAPAATDPLAGSLPEPLAELHAKVERGQELSRAERAALGLYGRRHPEDPRPRLILAHHFTDVRSLSWALPQYEEALEIDPSVRRDPQMLPDLLEMARSGSLHRRAVELIARVYGRDALPAVRRQLEQRPRRTERQRLERLVERLEATP